MIYLLAGEITGALSVTITDFTLPTAATVAGVVDRFDVSAFLVAANFAAAFDEVVNVTAAGTITDLTADTDVAILGGQTYADTAAVDAAITADTTVGTTDMIIFWVDSFNRVHVSYTLDADAGASVDIGILTGVAIADVGTYLTTTNMATFFDIVP